MIRSYTILAVLFCTLSGSLAAGRDLSYNARAVQELITGYDQLTRGEKEPAAEVIARALSYDKDSEFLKVFYASVLLDLDRHEEVIDLLKPLARDEDTLKTEVFRMLAVSSQATGRKDEAIRYYKRALKADAGQKWIRRRLLEMLSEQGRYREMVPVYKLLLDPGSGSYALDLLRMGALYLKIGGQDPAIRHLEQAIEADSTLADAYQLLGNVYERKGDWNRSLENYLRFLELEPEQMGRMQGRVLSVALRSAYPALGAGAVSRDSLSVRNDSSAWREMLQKLETRVSAGDSLKPFLLRVISVGYEALGEHETAIRIYGELLAGNPEDKISRRGLLRMLDAAGRYKEMIPVYEPLLDPEDRNYPRDLFQIGHLCFRTGHREKALEYLEKCVAVDSSLAEGYLLLGNFHQLESNWRQALQNYLTYLGFNPGAVRELWDRLLIVSIRAGQLEGPVALLEGLAAGGDTSAWNTEALGTLYYHTGKYEDALRLIEPLEECGGLSENGYYTLGFVYSRLDRTGDAVEAFGEVKRRRPDFMEVYLVLGRLYYTMKSLDRAEEIFSAGLERVGEDDRDNHRELLFSLANIYHEQGDDSKTEAYLKLVLEQDPDYAQALNYLGYFYAERGTNLEQARQMITRALEKDPGNGHYIDSLGWVLFKMGEHKKALGYIRKSLEIVGDQEEVYEHLGDIHHAMGKPELAREAWNKGLEMNGRNLKLQKKLEQLEAELNSETSDK